MYNEIFSPFKVGSLEIKNRFVLCAMEGTNILEGLVGYKFNHKCREFFIERAKNDVGLIVCGMTPVKAFMGEKWLHQQEKIFNGPVKELMDEVHKYGAKFFIQIGAGMGRVMVTVPMIENLYFSKTKKRMLKLLGMDVDRMFLAPTKDMPNVWNPDVKTIEMTKKDIDNVIDSFGKSALLAKNAGVDGVEIHAVHEGYLLDQFTMQITNKREDEYGGTLENRARLTCEIIKSIKDYCGQDFPVSVRYSVTSKMKGFNKGALPGEIYKEAGRDREESVKLARILEKAGADMLNADNGSYDAWYWAHPPVYMPHECNLEDSIFLKKHVNIPVVCAGRMENAFIANKAIKNGDIDGVGIARQFLTDGEYIPKVKEGRIKDIRPCIACHNGCFAVYRYKGLSGDLPEFGLGRCALNPYTMDEENHRIIPTETPKKIAIIGGGVAGMEVARVAKLRGHMPEIYEKTDELGGVFIQAAAPKYKGKDRMFLQWCKNQMKDLDIPIHFNTEIKSYDELDADEVVLATGTKPRKLNTPGIDSNQVLEAIEYLNYDKEVGDNVLVLGGGLTGCEIAYELAEAGKKVVITEIQDDILKVKNLSAANSNMLRDLLNYHKVDIQLETQVTKIEKGQVEVKNSKGEEYSIKADTVILCCGYTPYTPFEPTLAKNIHLVGDAIKPGNLLTAIWAGYELAMKL